MSEDVHAQLAAALAEIERLNAWGPDHVTDAERAALAEDNLADARLQLDQLATRLACVEAERDAANHAAAQWRHIADLEHMDHRRAWWYEHRPAVLWVAAFAVIVALLLLIGGAR